MTLPPPGPTGSDAPSGGDAWAPPATPGHSSFPPPPPSAPGPPRDRRMLWWGLGLGAAGLVVGAGTLLVVLAVVVGPALGRGLTAGADRGAQDGADVSALEQDYLDTLEDVTYYNFSDEDLVAMGHQLCGALDDGEDLTDVETGLSDDFGAGGGDTWDIAWSATHVLCEQHAGLTDDDGHADGDGSDGTLDTGWSRA